MNLTKRHILNIINGNMLTPEQMATAILEKAEHQNHTIHLLSKNQEAQAQLNKKHAAALTKLKTEALEIYAQCDHEWKVSGDPSGGTDRDTTCTICGFQGE